MPLLPSHTLLQTYSLTLLISSYLLLTTPLTLLNSSPLWLLGESMQIRPAYFTPPSLLNQQSHSSDASTTGPNGIKLTRRRNSPPFFPLLSTINPSDLLPASTRELLSLLALVLFIAAITQSVLATSLRYNSSSLNELSRKSVKSSSVYQKSRDATELAEKIHTVYTAQNLFLTISALRVLGEGLLVAYIYVFFRDSSINFSSSTFTAGSDGTGENSIYDETNRVGGGMMLDGVVSTTGLLANRITFSFAMADMLFWGYLWTTLREEAKEIAGVVARRRGALEEVEDQN